MSSFRGEQLAYRTADTNTDIKGIHRGTTIVNPASIAADASLETVVTIAGLEIGDEILFFPPVSLETALAYSGGRVSTSAVDTAFLRLSNISEGASDGIARTWTYIWFDLT